MDLLHIEQCPWLSGDVRISGAKNAALPIMAAALMADGPVRLDRVPWLLDVGTLCKVLNRLGTRIEHSDDGRMWLETIEPSLHCAGYEFVRRMRASFCVLGPLLARRGRATVALPGGCRLGVRPVELHLKGLEALGAELRTQRGYVIATARRLRGAEIDLTGPCGPTVTGTANVMCAAALAKGRAMIHGAAREPEIVDLGNFLNSLGADIHGLGSPTIEIRGVDSLRQSPDTAAYRIIPDRIEAATYLIAVAMVGGRIEVRGAEPGHLASVLELLGDAGADIHLDDDAICIETGDCPRPFHATARPYPGLPTDVQPLLVALATCANGRSEICDEVFPERWAHVGELTRLGAKIARSAATARIVGSRQELSGAHVTAHDLRSGAALVLAGLAARGRTTIHGAAHLDRGYELLERKLSALGARVERASSARAAAGEDLTPTPAIA